MDNESIIRFEGYDLYRDEMLGAGGGGSVYKAYDKNLRKDVVIKKIHEDTVSEEDMRIEVDILKDLHHKSIPQVFNYLQKDGLGYTVMEYIKGSSFGDYIKAGTKFSEKEVIDYAIQLCEVVDYLHSREIPVIHGDIKPDNIMLTPDKQLFLIDFNISGTSKEGVTTTLGYTPGFSAPEQYEQYIRLANLVELSDDDEKTELLGQYNNKYLTEDDKTELIREFEKDFSEDDKTELVNAIKQESNIFLNTDSSKKLEEEKIYIDKRSDVYSIAATIYYLYKGVRYDKDKEKKFASNASDGLVYVLNKALSVNPNKRYQSAGEMLEDLKNLHKKDKQYKSQRAFVALGQIMCAIGIAIGVMLIVIGFKVVDKEKEEKYINCIDEMSTSIVKMDEEGFEEAYSIAVNLFPRKIDAYYEKANFLHRLGNYAECVDFIENDVIDNVDYTNSNVIADIYRILANAYYELEEYEYAETNFKEAIKYDNTNTALYGELAIALAVQGKADEANDVLQQAINNDMSEDIVYLAKAEIGEAMGNIDESVDYYNKCIDITKDDYTKQRAYIKLSALYREQGKIDTNNQILDKAIKELPEEYHATIFNERAKANIAAASDSSQQINIRNEYRQKAIDSLNMIVELHMDSFDTHYSLANLYHAIEDFDSALAEVEEMKKMDETNYKAYLSHALLELDIQNRGAQNYELFDELYNKTVELYSKQMSGNKTDAQMDQLTVYYNQIHQIGE